MTFPQQLFVDLRRAGWPVSPVLEGRIQLGGRSFGCWDRAHHPPAEVGNAPASDERSAILHDAAGTNAGGARNALRSWFDGRRDADGEWRRRAAAVAVQAQLVPDVLVVDIGVAQRLLNMPDQFPASSSARRKANAHRSKALRATGCVWSRRTPRATRTAHRQLSPQPDRVRAAVLCRWPVHRQFGHWFWRSSSGCRCCAPCAALRGIGAPAEFGAAGGTGVAGAARGIVD